ncbi:26S proteasome non-ATPase regulatory subunit 10-like [Scylla paramamosain]|uniref:26S proteasome non-ATPase regulatory subunit 10-like n=1 Tax=Scylla paramamosain TaxID=85552 RepID=UPI003083A789
MPRVSVCLVTVAAGKGHHHLLRCLLQAGLNIEGGGTIDRTPLMEAAGKGHNQTVKALLTLGANPLATDSKGEAVLSRPVHAASHRGHVEVLEQLAGAGWPLTARDSDGDTPLHHAAAGGSVTCQEWLEQRGGDPRVQNKAGHTPRDKLVEELRTALEGPINEDLFSIVRQKCKISNT